jgi:type I restriction enzyme R subunit
MNTDTSEKGLESLVVEAMTGVTSSPLATSEVHNAKIHYSGTGWILGKATDFNREYAIDVYQLKTFLKATQAAAAQTIDIDNDSPTRLKFLARLQGEITNKGIIDVLRKGINHGPVHLDLFYGKPSEENSKAIENFAKNRFSVTRQLRYSRDETRLALDLCLFINGLPVTTFELKNSLTKQNVNDAVAQYMRDRDPRELIFGFGRCLVHFAVDEQAVMMCTQLKSNSSWFLPFNIGWNDGAGNPPNPDGLKTEYLWNRILTPNSFTNVLENYAQMVERKDEKTGRVIKDQIFPRYHQLDVVRKLLADIQKQGVGKRYLIEHSAGSGKSNSIAWLAHQLIGLRKNDSDVFNTIIVVTDRRLLDKQLRDTIKQFTQVGSTIGAVTEGSKQLKEFIESGKKIIISTVQKFPVILDEIGTAHRTRNFAIIIDEAHSSQGGRTSAAMSMVLSKHDTEDEEETYEDIINRIMEEKKLLPNASYFAFTATPKNKTLEIFGDSYEETGKTKHRPFHSYTMKQAIQESFILDVLENYTPIESYYKLIKKTEEDPEFDTKRAQKKLRKYVESHDHAIRLKAEIMVDHFHEQVASRNKIGGQARAMIVTSGIERAIQYYHAFQEYLIERKSPFKAIVAFSGDHEYKGLNVSEISLNGFSSNKIADKIKEDPYRFLICADKYQTGYDEPLLHTMYVDKVLSGIKAVQTLSRLNRAHPLKKDVFVLDFMNDADTIKEAFSPYYRTTILSEETDPDKLHDLKAALDKYQVYSPIDVENLVKLFISGAPRDQLDRILDNCVEAYKALDEDPQVDFKSKAKGFCRIYNFLSSILPYSRRDWEELSIFLRFLILKLPEPKDEDLSKGIQDSIDMDSYRIEKKATMEIKLPDANAEIEPVPTSATAHKLEPEMDTLSHIIKTFNDQFGNVSWTDADRVHNLITKDIPSWVSADVAYQNAKQNSDKQNARIEHDKALARVMTAVLKDDTELFKQFSDNEVFRKWLTDTVFALTYRP